MRSIHRHLIFWLLSCLLVLCLVAIISIIAAFRRSLVAEFDRSLIPQLNNAQLILRPGPLGFNSEINRSPDVYIQAWDSDTQNTLYKSENLGKRKLPFREVNNHSTEHWDFTFENGEQIRLAATGILTFTGRGEDLAGNAVVVAVAKDRSSLESAVRRLLFSAGAIGLLGSLFTAAIAVWVLRKGLKPLDHLGEKVDRIDSGTLADRLETGGMPAELLPFANRINELLDRLEAAFVREREFSSDLSHELRTPIAEIRSIAEFAMMYPNRAEESDYQNIFETTERLTAIVEAQLALSRIESSHELEGHEQMDLEEFIPVIWKSYSNAAEEKSIRSNLTFEGPRHLKTHPGILTTILENLFSNAVEYTPESGSITFELIPGDSDDIFRISNTAPNLEDADLDKLFNRLWRKQESRSDANHFGLGLSLARACAKALGFRLIPKLDSGELSITLSLDSPN